MPTDPSAPCVPEPGARVDAASAAAPRTVDAVVVGGGPAGSAAAIALARLGWSTLLLERRGAPTGERAVARPHKTCGHCLSPRADAALETLGLRELVHAMAESRHESLRIDTARRGVESGVALPLRRAGIVVRRDRLDPALRTAAMRAGVAVVVGQRCVAIGPSRTGGRRQVVISTGGTTRTIDAQLVVGADGLGSGVARDAGLASSPRGVAIGVSFDLDRSTAESWPQHLLPEVGEVRMRLGRAGYLGLVRESDGRIHAAALLHRPETRSARDGRFAVDQAISALLGGEIPPSSIASLPRVGASPMPWRPRSVATAGVALVGDAAGYVEPFTGEGMAWAFESAVILAESLATARTGPRAFDAAIAERYTRRWRAVVGRAQRRCGLIGAVLRRPALVSVAARRIPRITGHLATAVAALVNRPSDGHATMAVAP